MDCVYGAIPGVHAYLDELKKQGENWCNCWAGILEVVEALVTAGVMINMRKCKLLARVIELLGQLVCQLIIILNDKYIYSWFSMPIKIIELHTVC